MWNKRFRKSDRKKFLHLIDYIIEAIDSGRLKSGEPLPTQRELAKKLDLSIGTITKAFAELEKMGYLSGEVGRGTFVRDISAEYSDFWYSEQKVPYRYNLGHFRTTELFNHSVQLNLLAAIRETASQQGLFFRLNDHDNCGAPAEREIFSAWLRNTGIDETDVRRICLIDSEFSATSHVIRTFTVPGDTVLLEELTDPVWKDQALSEHRRVAFVQMDQDGIIPESLEKKISETGARLMITTPTFHNPTGITTSRKRKEEISSICSRHKTRIAELGHLDLFLGEKSNPYYTMDPATGIYICGMYFHINPALNTTAIIADETAVERIEMNYKLHNWSASGLLHSTSTRLIETGRADVIVREKGALLKNRNELTTKILGQKAAHSHSVLRWIPVPEQWNSAQLTQAAYERGILIRNADLFNMNRKQIMPFVRISQGAINDTDQFTEALHQLNQLMHEGYSI